MPACCGVAINEPLAAFTRLMRCGRDIPLRSRRIWSSCSAYWQRAPSGRASPIALGPFKKRDGRNDHDVHSISSAPGWPGDSSPRLQRSAD
jgi:hypothetical protein